jgi:hypothetical protein
MIIWSARVENASGAYFAIYSTNFIRIIPNSACATFLQTGVPGLLPNGAIYTC